MSFSLRSNLLSLALVALAGSAALMTTGCAVGGASLNQAATTIATPAVTVAQGSVHGGNQPVVGATVQLYYVGTPATGSGYGVGATAFGTPQTTNATGNFTLTGKYTCPTPAAQVYVVATGGNPGLSPSGTATSVNNQYLAEMAALGTCPAGGNLLATIPNINISEVTTVAAVFALQNFMAAPATANTLKPSIGAPTTTYSSTSGTLAVQSAVVGMNNGFTTAKVLADINTGLSPNTNFSYATPDSAKMNTIADILSYCVNSDPSVSTNCSSLMTAATPSTASFTAADTIQATWYMAQNPINNISGLYALVDPTPPFIGLTAAPKDWTVAITYAPTTATSTAAINAGFGVAIDGYGNAWIANQAGSSVVELGVDGSTIMQPVTTFTASLTGGSAPLFTTPPAALRTVTAPKDVAVDLNNNAWVANYESATGGLIGTTAAPTGDLVTFTGSTAAGTGGLGGGLVNGGYFVGPYPYSVAVDSTNNILVTNTGSATASPAYSSLSRMSATGANFVYSTSAGALNGANRLNGGSTGNLSLLAIDNNPNVPGGIAWAVNSQGCAIAGAVGAASTKWGTVNQFSDTTTAALNGSQLVSSFSNATVGAGSATNCGSTTYTIGQVISAGMANPSGIAVDRYNNVWVSNEITSSTGFDGLTYLIAPTANTGIVPTSYNIYDANATAPAAGVSPTVSGTTIRKASVMAVDGNNNVWVSGETLASVAELSINRSNGTATFYTPGQNGTSSPTTNAGFNHNISVTFGMAIDQSGNVWVTSTGTGSYTNAAGVSSPDLNSVTVIVGAAAPVVAPMALALSNTRIGQKP